MSSRLLVLVLVLAAAPAAFAPPAAAAPLTKPEVIKRAAEICRHGRDAMARHIRRAAKALAQRRPIAFERHGRRWARAGLRHVTRLRRVREPAVGSFWFKRFVDRSRGTFGWIELAMDALDQRHTRLYERRLARAGRHRERAQKAAREYGLRKVCVRFLEA